MTLKRLEPEIQNYRDLRDRLVATVTDSISETALEGIGAVIVPVPRIEQAYEYLENGKVEAVVFDVPVLRFLAHHKGAGKVMVLDEIFNQEYYGIALPNESPLREDINRAIIQMRESGAYQSIYQKWFGY